MLRGSAIFVAAALLAACIGGDDDGDEPPSRAEKPPAERGVRLGIGGPLTVDPMDASLASPSDLMVLDLLHDGLTRVDADGVAQPALAESWEANAAATAFRFVLDADATFTSGRRVTPDDVIASLERVMKPGDTSLAALSLEAVEGFRAFADGEAKHVSGLTAPGPRTVRIALATPLSVLPAVLSSPVMSVVDRKSLDGDLEELDLSGAWSVASATEDTVVLDRRDGDSDGLSTIELRAHEDREAAYDAFEDGDVDWAEVPPSKYEQAIEDHGDDAFAPFQAELFFGLNVNAAALRSEGFRQAIRLAIDPAEIVDAVYADLADPLTTVVPAGVAGHDPERCPACASDPEQATAILRYAFPDSDVPTVHIDFDESPSQEAMAQAVADSLEEVGIPTELRPRTLGEYEAFVVSGRQEVFSFGWIGAYASPDAYLAPLFGSSANDNLTGYRSDQVDGLLERARAGSDAAKNAERWAASEKVVLDAAVVIPIAQFRTQVVVSSRIEGLEHAVDGSVDWTQVRLAT